LGEETHEAPKGFYKSNLRMDVADVDLVALCDIAQGHHALDA
jgi:hypothetical protein